MQCFLSFFELEKITPRSLFASLPISKSYIIHYYRAKTFTTPSPPPLTTHLPSWLQTTEQTPSPRISRWLVISCVQLRFSNDQKRRLASWPAETSSLPSGERDRAEMAAGWASMLYVHWPEFVNQHYCRRTDIVDRGT